MFYFFLDFFLVKDLSTGAYLLCKAGIMDMLMSGPLTPPLYILLLYMLLFHRLSRSIIASIIHPFPLSRNLCIISHNEILLYTILVSVIWANNYLLAPTLSLVPNLLRLLTLMSESTPIHSFDQSHYSVVFIDYFTKHSWIYWIKLKSDVNFWQI